jgi:hypothetical protein
MADYCAGASCYCSRGRKEREKVADYSEAGLGGFPGKWSSDKKQLATEEVLTEEPSVDVYTKPVEDKRPEKWNTEWDAAYELGLKHGIEREREKWLERFEKLKRDLTFEVR